jgi:hypothetical protein
VAPYRFKVLRMPWNQELAGLSTPNKYFFPSYTDVTEHAAVIMIMSLRSLYMREVRQLSQQAHVASCICYRSIAIITQLSVLFSNLTALARIVKSVE